MQVHKFIENLQKDNEGHILLNLIDNSILHNSYLESALRCSAPGFEKKPQLVRYVKGQSKWDGITIFTDKTFHLVNHVESKIKVAWPIECYELLPSAYQCLDEYGKYFDLIFTYEKSVFDKFPQKSVFHPCDTSGIEIESHKIHEKTKLISMIYSDKTWLFGHRLRHIIAKSLIPEMGYDKVDFFGRGTNTPINLKSEGTNPYMFQIVTENAKRYNYFTDKIYDCFVTGTIPIYWGAPNIGDHFDKGGILSFEHPDELKQILLGLSREKYNSMLSSVQENFERVKYYLRPDDLLYEQIIKNLIKRHK